MTRTTRSRRFLYSLAILLVALVLGSILLWHPGDSGQSSEMVFDGERAYRDVTVQMEFGPRITGTEGNRKCADYIAEQLKQTEDDLTGDRMSIVRELAPYRGKMSADQIAMLERQYLMRKLLDRGRLPRLSLFYLT